MIARDQAEPARIRHLAEAIKKAIGTRREVKTHCPVHDDNNPSLSVRGTARGLRVKCWAGVCSEAEIKAEIKALGLWPKEPGRKLVKRYPYRDESGTTVFEKVRYEPKAFSLRRPDGKRGWSYNIKGLTPIPYQLDLLAQAPPDTKILIVGGEKDCDNAAKLGQLATTSHCGEGKNWPREIDHYFANRDVTIIADNDEAGEIYAKSAATNLQPIAVRIVRLPGLPPKGDLTDWIAQGGTREQLLKLIEEARTLCDADLGDLEAEALESSPQGLRDFNDGYIVLRDPAAILRKKNGKLYSRATFCTLLEADKFLPDGSAAATRWIGWSGRDICEGLAFEPGQPRRLPDGRWNMIAPREPLPMDSDSVARYHEAIRTEFFPFLRGLYGSVLSPEAVMVMQWAAYPLQHPGTKLFTGYVLVGPPGCGKSLLLECYSAGYAPETVINAELDDQLHRFNFELLGKMFVPCDELNIKIGADPRRIADKIKNLITRVGRAQTIGHAPGRRPPTALRRCGGISTRLFRFPRRRRGPVTFRAARYAGRSPVFKRRPSRSEIAHLRSEQQCAPAKTRRFRRAQELKFSRNFRRSCGRSMR